MSLKWHFPLSLLSWCSVSMQVTAGFRSGTQADNKVWPSVGPDCTLPCWLRSMTNGEHLEKQADLNWSQTQLNAKCTSRAWMCLPGCVSCKAWACRCPLQGESAAVCVCVHATMRHHMFAYTAACCLNWLWCDPASWITVYTCKNGKISIQLEDIK